jgi:translation initiation factor 2 subunit 2
MDADGNISDAVHGEDRTTAEKHTSRMSPPHPVFTVPYLTSPLLAPTADLEVDKMTDMFANMAKKKKKPSSKSKTAAAEDGEDAPTPPAEGGEFDASVMKKKKKKSSKPKAADDSFEAKLAKAGVEGDDTGAGETNGDVVEQEGDPIAGTGIWAHNTSTPISYPLLLNRFFTLLNQYNPDILSSGSKSYKIPPPQCLREGNKKTIFANIAEICKRMKRSDEHVTQFLFAELGTSGSVDGSKRLVIKGRFQQKQIENVLRRYIGTLSISQYYLSCTNVGLVEYVTCKTCRSPDTELNKGENRLYFVTCNSCGSRRSVTAIKSGFTAQIGKRKRLNG